MPNEWELTDGDLESMGYDKDFETKLIIALTAQKKLVKWLDEACLYPDDKLSDYEYNGTPLEFDLCIGDWKYLKRELGIE